MNIYVLFVQRVETRPGQYAPEAVAAVEETGLDEVSLDTLETEYIDGWNNQFAEDDENGFEQTFSARSWVKVELSRTAQEIRDYLRDPMTVKGFIQEKGSPKGSNRALGGITVTQGRKGGTIIDDEIID